MIRHSNVNLAWFGSTDLSAVLLQLLEFRQGRAKSSVTVLDLASGLAAIKVARLEAVYAGWMDAPAHTSATFGTLAFDKTLIDRQIVTDAASPRVAGVFVVVITVCDPQVNVAQDEAVVWIIKESLGNQLDVRDVWL